MNGLSLALALIITLATGWFLAAWMLPGQGAAKSLARASLAVGLGFAVSSAAHYLTLNLAPDMTSGGGFLDLIFLAAAAGLWKLAPGHPDDEREPRTETHPFGGLARALTVVLVVVLVADLVAIVAGCIENPHGRYDAWMIWNMRARFFFRAGEQWTDAFHAAMSYSHLDYPLLVPLNVARLWSYFGSEATWVPPLLGVLLAFATVGLVTATLWITRSPAQALLAALAILALPMVVLHASLQYADEPLAYYYAGALCLLVLSAWPGLPQRRLIVMAGVMTGAAACTKNEGLLFAVAVGFALGAAVLMGRSRADLARAALFALGLSAPLAFAVSMKGHAPGSNDLIGAIDLRALREQWTDPWRYWTIVEYFWLLVVGRSHNLIVPLLVCYVAIAGSIKIWRRDPIVTALTFILVLVAAGYFAVYMITPYDLEDHLTTSQNRLFLHVWPSLVLLIMSSTRLPEQMIGARLRGIRGVAQES